MELYIIFIIIMNIISFMAYSIDKRKAARRKHRLDESLLLGLGILGGALGALAAMKLFHHKTRKNYFWNVNIISFFIHCLLFVYIIS